MRERSAILAVLCAGVALLAGSCLATPAAAAGISPPVADCIHNGQLTHNYSVAELRSALNSLPADVTEYSTCSTVIQHALNAKIGKLRGGSGSGGGSFLPTWLLIVLIVLVLGGVAFVTAAIRRRGDGRQGPPPPAAA
jgi:hypothetical protein